MQNSLKVLKRKVLENPHKLTELEERKLAIQQQRSANRVSLSNEQARKEVLLQEVAAKDAEIERVTKKEQKLLSLRDIVTEQEEMDKMLLNFVEKAESVRKHSESILRELGENFDLDSFGIASPQKIIEQTKDKKIESVVAKYENALRQEKLALENAKKIIKNNLTDINIRVRW